jgi:hypothetical protein
VPLRVTVKSFKDAASDRVKLLVAAALGGPAGGATARAVGFVVTNDRGEAQASSLDTSPSAATPYVGAALVDPGTFNLKLAVVDERGRRGSVEHRFDARLRAGGPFRFSDVVLADGAVGKDLVPAIEPRVSREVVTGYLEIYASDPDRFERTSAAFEIARDADAPVLAGSPAVLAETADARWRVVQGSVPVTGLDPGEYVLRSVVSVAGRPVARFSTPFTLVSRAAR